MSDPPQVCPHYDREEINLVMDGMTPPVLRCRNCGAYICEHRKTEPHDYYTPDEEDSSKEDYLTRCPGPAKEGL